MPDPVIEQIKREIAAEFEVPLPFLEKFLQAEEEKVHFARRHGLIDELRRLTAQQTRSIDHNGPNETPDDTAP